MALSGKEGFSLLTALVPHESRNTRALYFPRNGLSQNNHRTKESQEEVQAP